jgi:hypothetical protein
MHNPAPTKPPSHDQYAFLNKEDHSTKRKWLPSPRDKKGKLVLFLGSIGFVALIFIIIAIIMSSMASKDRDEWVSLAKQQQEIIRISELAEKNSNSEQTKILAANISITMKSSQKEIHSLVKKSGAKISTKILSTGEDKQVTKDLEAAQQNGNFDALFQSIIKEKLVDYQVSLRNIKKQVKASSSTEILNSAYDNAELLASQAAL